MVGTAVSEYCRAQLDDVAAYDHQALDISDRDLVRATIGSEKPDVVINCAAWTDVDGCESNPQRAEAANVRGPENLACASREVGGLFVTISTDYVFGGQKEGFYTQRDDPNPTSVYGISKLEGERGAMATSARTIVIRSGFIFGPGGRNFLSTVAGRLKRGDKIAAINDSWGTPTYGLHLAARLRELATVDLPGIYHVVNSGDGVTYEEFARFTATVLNADQGL